MSNRKFLIYIPVWMRGYILYPAYMPGTSQGGETHTLWDPPLCEVPDIYVGYRIYKIRLDRVCVQCFCISRFFFFLMRSTFQCFSMGSMHSLWNSQTSFFNKTFIKNGSHGTIHTQFLSQLYFIIN